MVKCTHERLTILKSKFRGISKVYCTDCRKEFKFKEEIIECEATLVDGIVTHSCFYNKGHSGPHKCMDGMIWVVR